MKEWIISNPGHGNVFAKGRAIRMVSKDSPIVEIVGENNAVVALVSLAPGGAIRERQQQQQE